MTKKDKEFALLLARVLAEVLVKNEKDILIIIERCMEGRK